MKIGLTNAEAMARLQQSGFNELPSAKPKGFWKLALEVVQEPMFILLLGCGLVYLLLGDYSEGIILLCWVIIIIGITFFQHRKTEKALDALRNLSSPRALVVRDGAELRIAGRAVVPGDIVILNEGDRVPADATVLESHNLTVDESLLTGESAPVLKSVGDEKAQQNALVFSGTLVVQGRGVVEVHSTGMQTQFGKIGVSLQEIEQDATRLQHELKILIRNLFIGGTVVSVGVTLAFYLTRGGVLSAILSGLSAAMALLPEEFPVVMTIFLALGAWRLSKNKILTRKPSAIESLGSATVLCSDKTGTITQNKMEIRSLYCHGELHDRISITDHNAGIGQLLNVLHTASPNNSIDPMEMAIAKDYAIFSKDVAVHRLLKEFSLSKELLAMTRVYEEDGSGRKFACCKGAPEAVLAMCNLSDATFAKIEEVAKKMAAQGYRVLAAAQNQTLQQIPERQDELEYVFVGLVAFEDPIRAEVPNAIQECKEAGINVILITGDYAETAKSIAAQIGIVNCDQAVTGAELQKMTEAELKIRIKKTQVFARIIPSQKLQIIQALKANGDVVAMTGDGVNDAPALKAADIGIAMGMKGTDVAREASSLVLLDDNFASIVHGVRLGRRIFDNLQKAMSYIIAIHIPIIGLVFLPAFNATLPILLLPIHIVFMELIIDPVCSIAFEAEQEEKGIMQRKPRNASERFFGVPLLAYSVFKGILLLGMVIAVYFISIKEGHTDDEVRAIAFSSLIVGNVFLILTSLSDTRNVFSILKEKNRAIFIISITAIGLLILTFTSSFLQNVFKFKHPGYGHLVPALAAAGVMLLILEGIKITRNYYNKMGKMEL